MKTSSRWSLILLPLFFAIIPFSESRASTDSVVVLNEIHYHSANATDSEWIELHSLHGVNVDMSGWKLAGGIDYTFPNGTIIQGHRFLVVAAVPSSSSLAGVGALGPWTGQLANSGEEIRLLNNNGRIMDAVTYGDGGDWPVGPDGSGATLVKADQESADSGPRHWTTSSRLNGSPGAANFPLPNAAPTITALVTLNGAWKYRDDDVLPDTNWMASSYVDTGWLSGGGLLYAGTPNITGAGEGLLGYWPLEETGAATTAPNAAPGGTVGTLFSGASWVTDTTRGKVLNLPGSGAYVSAGSIPQMTLANDFTWSFWANSAASSGSSVILGNRYSPTGADFSPTEFIKFTPSQFEFYRGGAQDGGLYSSMPAGSWVHNAVVKMGSTLTYYRNGSVSASRTISAGLNNPQPFYFGGDKAAESWTGKLDDVAVWTKALPASSISGLGNNTLTPLTAPTGSSGGTLTKQVTIGPVTHYFRTTFTFNGDKARTTLTLQHMLDDGAVFYLNGTEVLRSNMPAGAVAHSTLASVNTASTILSDVLTIPSAALVPGANVLAVEVHQASAVAPNNDMVFGASLTATETAAPVRVPGSGVLFNEISGAIDPQFRIELLNSSTAAIDLAGYKIVSSSGAVAVLPAQSIPSGGMAVITAAQLGFTPADGDKLFLFQPDGINFEDARAVTNRLRGRTGGKDSSWSYPSAASFGAANTFSFNSAVIINEIMYKPHATSAAQEKWIELYNRGAADADLSGWQIADGISFTFPIGTMLAAGSYLVLTNDMAAFATHHPGVRVLGPFSGNLSGQGEHLELDDVAGNPVDEVRFYSGGRWAENAHGGGSSLERRDPRADSNAGETWAASNEAARGSWQTFTWQGIAASLNGDPTQWNEFIFGLLDAGTFLIDDISVKNLSSGNVELIQNGGFESGATAGWRFLGTHQRATVVNDPSGSGKVLQIVATGATEHMHNHAETTLKSGASFVPINSANTYQISYRARWVSGSNQLNSRLYFNRLARTNLLPIAAGGGTPGAANSTAVSNIGPSYSHLTHSPAVPAAGQAAVVSVTATDPDGITALSLYYKVGAGAFTSLPMTLLDGIYSATIPGQAAGAKVQFYVQATDSQSAVSFFPSGGAASRAIIPWNDGQARLTLNGSSPNNVRIVMTDAEAAAMHVVTTVMSNDHIGCTVIYNENEIFYGCGVRLKGSERGRDQDTRVSFNIDFPADHKFLGAHDGIALDRSGAGNQTSQKEILVKHAITHAGNIPGSEDDLCRIIAPLSKHTGPGIMVKQRFDSDYLDNQYAKGSDGRLFKFEYIYYPTTNSVSGNVESLKIPEPDNVVTSVGVAGLGADKELYRWHWLNLNNQEADDYSGLMTWLPTFGRAADAQYFIDAAKYIDTDEWLRSFAIESLFGIGDNYGGGNAGHNVIFYQRPSDMRWLLFPHDMDFTFSNSSIGALAGNPDLNKLISKGSNLRAFYGHILDICTTTFNRTYLQPWALNYNTVLNEDLTTYMSYVDSRRAYALSTINTAIPPVSFAITSSNTLVNAPFVTITGTGWINVREIRLAGSSEPLAVTWTSANMWQVSVPLAPGANNITLQAVGFDGAVLASTSQTITNNGATQPAAAGNIVISKIMYHPGLANAAEQQAGYGAAGAEDEFEFIEIMNISAASVDITGAHFTAGIEYTFPARIVAAGERLVVARTSAAFAMRYPSVPAAVRFGPFTSGKLSDSGETLTLTNAGGQTIFSVAYSDASPWPTGADGEGPSLVLIRPQTNPNAALPQNWRHSADFKGSPGVADTLSYDAFKIAANFTDDNADPDRDGLSNFLEYAHGTSPLASNPLQIALTFSAAKEPVIHYTRRIGADDVTWDFQTSNDLVNWITAPTSFVYDGVHFNGDGTEDVRYLITPPAAADPRRFVRARASR